MPRKPPRNKIIHGTAVEEMRKWRDDSIDHCIADPPFNMSKKRGLGWAFSSHVTMEESWDRFGKDEFFRFNVEWLREVCRVVKPNGNLVVFGTYHNIYQLGFILQNVLGLRLVNSIVWYKPNAQPNITARMLTESTEYLIWAVNGPASGPSKASNWTFNYWKAKELGDDRQHRNILGGKLPGLPSIRLTHPVVSKNERRNGKHPSQKPVQLVETLLGLFTTPRDLVLDPFAGSGALAQAAIRRARDFVLIEKDAEYHALAKKKVSDERRAKRGAIHRWAELRRQPLTESEIRVLDNVPVPQADRLNLVIEVIEIVQDGADSRTAIANHLASVEHDEYDARQGAYYGDAAYALGWIRPSEADASRFVVTERGLEVAAASGAGLRRLVWDDIGSMHFGFIADDLGIDLKAGVPDEDFATALGQWFELEKSTAKRRTNTATHWVAQLVEREIH